MHCGVQWPLNHLPSCQNNYIFIYLGMPPKMDDNSVFSFSFSSKSTLVASICYIYNYRPFCCHFYQVPQKTIILKVTKMVDLDKSHKCMGWNGLDSLQCQQTRKHETKPLKKTNVHNHDRHTYIQKHSNATCLIVTNYYNIPINFSALVVGQCHINYCNEFLSQDP